MILTAEPLFRSPQAIKVFSRQLKTRYLGKQIVFLPRTHSTNDLAMQAARDPMVPHGQIFITDAQDSGRGRRGRKWECEPGLGLLFSVLIRSLPGSGLTKLNIANEDMYWIPLAAGLAVVEGIQAAKICGHEHPIQDGKHVRICVKWPNDIVVPSPHAPGWRKLGGILCESVLPAGPATGVEGQLGHVVIGIGLNINHTQSALPPTDKAPATSLCVETGGAVSRTVVLRKILERLEQRLSDLASATTREELKHSVEAQLRKWWQADRKLTVQTPGHGIRQGCFCGLDSTGRLKLKDENGKMFELPDGEILNASTC